MPAFTKVSKVAKQRLELMRSERQIEEAQAQVVALRRALAARKGSHTFGPFGSAGACLHS